MSRSFTLLFASGMILVATPASAGAWSLGSHFGLSTLKGSKGGGTSTVLAWPANAIAYQPALRVGFGDSRRTHELQLDTGLFLLDEGGSTLTLFVGSASYQYTVASSWPNAPFANASVGFYREGGAARSATAPSFGVGIGMRHLVRDGHGALRFEGRVDRLHEAPEFERPGLTSFGLRLGFDLWL